MNHLDVGFDGINPILGYAINVINKYFDVYFPAAVQTANALRSLNNGTALIYTTHPWLVSIYLDCPNAMIPQNFPGIDVPLHCPNETMLQEFEAAIQRGDITWHAFPFNAEPEFMDPSIFEYAVTIAHDLDVQYGKAKKTVMSQRDVPGMTRSVVPLLRKSGVKAITIGSNGGSAPPDVPKAFVWRDTDSDTDIIGMLHPGGYGGIQIKDCVIVPGFDHALAYAFRGDNAGPPGVDEVISDFATLQSEFPNATVFASTYDAFVRHLETVKDQLPVVKDEIGDTWIYGVPSDPLKVAQWRMILRLRTACLSNKKCDPDDIRFKQFNRVLVKNAEHTWGMDVKTFLHDNYNWSNVNFEKALPGQNYQNMISSWLEQRGYIYNAIQVLGDHPLAAEINSSFQQLVPSVPNPAAEGYEPVANFSTVFTVHNILQFAFDPNHGAITYLLYHEKQWATSDHPLSKFRYETLSAKDYQVFLDTYGWSATDPYFPQDLGKPNVSIADPQHRIFHPTLTSLWQKPGHEGSLSIWQELVMEDAEAYTKYGSPKVLWMRYDVDGHAKNIHITLMWFNKTATRLPEAIWLTFNPVPQSPDWSYKVIKLNKEVDPFKVVLNGSHHLHSVDRVHYSKDKGNTLVLESPDAAVVSLGNPNPFPIPLDKSPDTKRNGFSWSLYNNIWGTNYIMWYPFVEEDRNSLFRFKISLP